MNNPTITYVLASDCFKSPDNIRTQNDPVADAELEANIGTTGMILENLIGVRVTRGADKGKYEIYAGGRRLAATHANIEKGVLDPEFMVPVLVAKSAKDAISMSLDENFLHVPMNPADECRAFQTIVDREKKTPAEIARRYGKTERFVHGRLRLANLADNVFEALRTGEIGIEVAQAYGSTGDRERQTKVFDDLAGSYQRNNPSEIRRLLASGSYRGSDPKAMLVGREAYLAAGGRIDSDLFSDESSETWLDAEIVERLAEEMLTATAAAIREREGFAEVRVVPMTHIPYSATYHLRPVEPEPAALSEEAAARDLEISAELSAIEAEVEAEGCCSEEQAARIRHLESERAALVPEAVDLTPAQKAGSIAYVLIDRDGTAKLHEEIFAVEQPEDEEPVESEQDDDRDEMSHADSDGHGDPDEEDKDSADSARYSVRLRDELAMMKTELLALHIARAPGFALDLGVFIMVDDACHRGWSGMPSELRAKAPTPRVHGFESDTAAFRAWSELEAGLDRSWVDQPVLEDRYDAFCALDEAARWAWLGWAVARTMTAVPDGQTGSAFIDHLGGKLGIQVATWWRPTARNFFDRVTKAMILDLFEDVGGRELRARYAASRKFDLQTSAEQLFAGEITSEADVKARALAWVPAAMRFAGPADADEAAAALERPLPSELGESEPDGLEGKAPVEESLKPDHMPEGGEPLPQAA
jgi:ParB family chromosome partitioning protein